MGIEMEPAHLENNLELSGKTEEAHPKLHGNSAPIYPVEKNECMCAQEDAPGPSDRRSRLF